MCGICKGIYLDCSVMQCQAIDNTLRELPVNVHVVVHRSQAGANPSGRNAVDWIWINKNVWMSVSDLSNAVQVSDSLIFTNLKAIFFGKYLSKRAFTASRSPVCRKAEIWKFTEIKGLSVIPSRRTRSSKLLPLGPITASLTFASAGEPKSERIHLQQHNVL